MGNLEHSRNIESASKPKGIDILPLPEGARDTALIQSKISPPTESNSQNCSQFAKLSYKTTSSVRATSTDFQALAEMHPKVQFACFITTDKLSKNYLAHWLPHADCSTVQLLGRKDREPWIRLTEQALHGLEHYTNVTVTAKRPRGSMGPQLGVEMSQWTPCSNFCCVVWLPVRQLT